MRRPHSTRQRLGSSTLRHRLRTTSSRLSRMGASRTKASLMRPRRILAWRPRKYRSRHPDTRITRPRLTALRVIQGGMPPPVETLQATPAARPLTAQVAGLIRRRRTAHQHRTLPRQPTVLGQTLSRCPITRLLPLHTIPEARWAAEDTTLAAEAVVARTPPAVTAEATAANCLTCTEYSDGRLRPPVSFALGSAAL